MSWKETFPGHFERPLDNVELLFKTVAEGGAPIQREHWAVKISAKFCLSDSIHDAEGALRLTWKRMRYDHPQIAAVLRGAVQVYEVPNASNIDSWIADTFHVTTNASVDDLIANSKPSILTTMHYLPHTSEILIQSTHWRIDGFGALNLLNNFFSALSAYPQEDVRFGDEGKNLAPSLVEAAKLDTCSTEGNQKAAAEIIESFLRGLPSIGLESEHNKVPGGTRRSELKLSAATTFGIINACKARQISVTTALHAALVIATQRLASTASSARPYTSWGTFSLRRYLASPYNNSAAYPTAVWQCGLPLSLKPSTFSDYVSQLGPFYKQLQTPSTREILYGLLTPYLDQVTGLFSQPPPPDMPGPSEPFLDSLGIVDQHLSPRHGDTVEITDFSLVGEMLISQLLVYVWTWQKKMSFSVNYNESFFQAKFVASFLEQFRDVLLSELGVQLH